MLNSCCIVSIIQIEWWNLIFQKAFGLPTSVYKFKSLYRTSVGTTRGQGIVRVVIILWHVPSKVDYAGPLEARTPYFSGAKCGLGLKIRLKLTTESISSLNVRRCLSAKSGLWFFLSSNSIICRRRYLQVNSFLAFHGKSVALRLWQRSKLSDTELSK